MTCNVTHISETDSTNRWLVEHGGKDDMVVWADYQTAGRGCGTNQWESEHGKNLLFSILLHPHRLAAHDQFLLSMAISLAIVDTLNPLLAACSSKTTDKPDHENPLTIKWPNDIYWNDRKLAGILIESQLAGANVRQSIIGVGLNVNQTVFVSDAPNPVSLAQITGHSYDLETLLHAIIESFATETDPDLPTRYRSQLYRRKGFHTYHDAHGAFEAELLTVEDQGHLLLRDRQGNLRRYAFKEVQFTSPLSSLQAKRQSQARGLGA